MNKPNNKRKKGSMECMERAFIELLKTKELNQVHVTDICKQAGLNRATFYASYADVYDLADSVRNKLEKALSEFYRRDFGVENYLKLFRHIKENQIFYKMYFKLGYENRCKILSYGRDGEESGERQTEEDSEILVEEYRTEFFRAGMIQLIRMWLYNGCRETPEEMYEIVEKIKK